MAWWQKLFQLGGFNKIMRKILILSIFIFIFCFLPKIAEAGIITKPVFHTGLIGYWNFQEGAGSTTYDKSGYDTGQDGTLASMSESDWVDGKIGKALDFDGTDDWVQIPAFAPSAKEFRTTGLTISAWYKGTDTAGGVVVQGYGNHSFGAYGLFLDNGKAMMSACNLPPQYYEDVQAISPSTYNDGDWHFFVGVVDESDDLVKIYVDGDEKKASAWYDDADYEPDSGGSGYQNLGIGAQDRSGVIETSKFVSGIVDEVRMYNRALNADEVQRLYNLSQPKILAPTNTGLVGYWSFEEGMGTQAGDMSGNGNNGTLENMEENDWVDGRVGQALDFDGNNDYVEIYDGRISDATEGTISAWVYIYGLADGAKMVTYGGGNVADPGNFTFDIRLDTNYYFGILQKSDSGNWSGIRGNTQLSINTWYHVALTSNGTSWSIYVNGQRENLSSLPVDVDGNNGDWFGDTICAETDKTSIGNIMYDGNYTGTYFNGKIDEVRIYDRDLSANEIEALYKSGLTKISASQNNQLTDGLVGLWSFNGPDMDGNEIYDRSGQGNTGTLSGPPTRAIGKVGQALDFNGSTDYVNVGSDNSLEAPTTTVTAWIKRDTTGVRQFIFADNKSSGSGRDHYLMIEVGSDDKLQAWFGDGTDEVHKLSTATIDTGFHHIGFIRDDVAETVQFIIDGTVESPQSYSVGTLITLGTDNMWIGRIDPGGGYHFDGIIDEVRMYNRVLSAQEVQRLYNLGR